MSYVYKIDDKIEIHCGRYPSDIVNTDVRGLLKEVYRTLSDEFLADDFTMFLKQSYSCKSVSIRSSKNCNWDSYPGRFLQRLRRSKILTKNNIGRTSPYKIKPEILASLNLFEDSAKPSIMESRLLDIFLRVEGYQSLEQTIAQNEHFQQHMSRIKQQDPKQYREAGGDYYDSIQRQKPADNDDQSLPGEAFGPNMPITVLDFSVRSRKIMVKERIKTVGELTRMSTDELSRIKYCGSSTIKDIQNRLSKFGLSLRQD